MRRLGEHLEMRRRMNRKPDRLSQSIVRHYCFVFGRSRVQSSARKQTVPREIFRGFLSPCRASPVQHVSTKQAMTSSTHLIFISLIVLLYNLM